MFLYVKEEMSVGTINFNISEHGIEGSLEVEGYSLGAEPKIDYIHVGKDPVRYKKYKHFDSSETESGSEPSSDQEEDTEESNGSQVDPEDSESSSASSLTETESEEVIEEINNVKSRWRFWPLAALLSTFSIAISPIVACIGALVTIFAYQRDRIRKTVVLFYDFEEETKRQYKEVCDSFEFAAGADEIRLGEAEFATPDCVKTNIPIPSISIDNRSLYLFPDLVLIEDNNNISKFSYEEDINILTTKTTVKSPNHPQDASLKNTEWKHSNKDGSRDKRYKNNKKMFNTIYEGIAFLISKDKNERFEIGISKTNSSKKIKNLSQKLPLDSRHEGSSADIEDEENMVELFKKCGNEKQKKVVKRLRERSGLDAKNMEKIRVKQNRGELKTSSKNYAKQKNTEDNTSMTLEEKYGIGELNTIKDMIKLLRKVSKTEKDKILENAENSEKIREISKMIEDGMSTENIIEELKFVSKTEEETSAIKRAENDTEFYSVPYEKAHLDLNNEKSLYEVPTRQTAECIKKVVVEESPIHKEIAARRVADAAGVSRMGSRIQDTLEEAIQHAIQKGWVREKRYLLFDPDQKTIPVRDRGDLEGKVRDIEYVPGPEIAEAVEQVARSSSGIGEDKLIQKVAHQLGFARAGSKIQKRVGSIIDTMIEEEMLASENGHLRDHTP
jgi:hypothetical protein